MLTNGITPDQLGGLQRYARELSSALVAQGAHVTVLTRQINREDPLAEVGSDGVVIKRFRVPSRDHPLYAALYPLAANRATASALRRLPRSTVVHVHFAMNAVAARVARRSYVQTFHAPMFKEIAAERSGRYRFPDVAESIAIRGFRRLERSVARGAGGHVVLSEFMREELAGLVGPARAGAATLLPGGLDTEYFCPGPPVRNAFAQGAGPLLFTARRLVPRTGVLELVRAMPRVLAASPGTRLAIAGDGALRETITGDVRRLGLGESVRLLGRVPDEELRGWYRAADLFVLPTQELEGFGLATAEALSCGTAALGTPAGATSELLLPLDPRLVALDTSSDALASSIVSLLERPDALASIAALARARVHPAMGWPAVAERYLALYASISP
jgi:glycosyltransferase involved in cell wall biosynthesis